ncbi:hypothetical protein EUX98_g7274 [Antrodiella citrinella]|uniref:Uncharacterized protein n=1 Tax=Antrodiella citrinella TaxID=2447956 RepID=A0A4S4MLZ4_9APHY|nr:hypothetical protein EUX98_g7274 [Antrodiella citrinella]
MVSSFHFRPLDLSTRTFTSLQLNMESRKRKRDDDASMTIVTFHAPGDRRFDRLLRESSLDEMKTALRKKLKVSSDSNIRLAQLRDGVKIDLDDEDDFDALYVLASKQKVVNISVAVEAAKKKRKKGKKKDDAEAGSVTSEPSSVPAAAPVEVTTQAQTPSSSKSAVSHQSQTTAVVEIAVKKRKSKSAEAARVSLGLPAEGSTSKKREKQPAMNGSKDVHSEIAQSEPPKQVNGAVKAPTPRKPSFASQLVDSISASYNNSSLSPDLVGTSETTTTGVTPTTADEFTSDAAKKKRVRAMKPKPSLSTAELTEAVSQAVAAVRSRHLLSNKNDVALTSAAPETRAESSSKSASSTAAADAELTSRPSSSSQSKSAPTVNTTIRSEKEARPLHIVPGSAISEVAMEGKGEGSSDESSESGSDEAREGSWENEQGQKDDDLTKLLAKAGVASLDDVDMDAVLRGPSIPKSKGGILAEIAESSSNEEDDKLSDHEESEEENDRSFRKLAKSLEKSHASSDEEQDEADASLVPPTYMNIDAPQTGDPKPLSLASTPSSVDQAEVASVLEEPSTETIPPSPAEAAPLESTDGSTAVNSSEKSSIENQSESSTDGPSTTPQSANEDPQDPIQPADDLEEPAEPQAPGSVVVPDDTIAPANVVQDEPTARAKASPLKASISRRMKNRRGEVPDDVDEQPVLINMLDELAAEKVDKRRKKATPVETSDEPAPASASAPSKPKKVAAPKSKGKATANTENATTKSSSATLMPPPPVLEEAPKTVAVPRSKGKAKATTDDAATKPSSATLIPPSVTGEAPKKARARSRASGETEDAPKRRGRPPLSEEEKAKRQAEKKAEQAKKKEIAEARALAKAAKEAAMPKKAPRQRAKTTRNAGEKTPDEDGAEEQVAPVATPKATQSKSVPTSMSKWTALSQDSEDAPDADMTMIDELRSSSPDYALGGNSATSSTAPASKQASADPSASKPRRTSSRDALFLQSQSQTQLPPPPSSPPQDDQQSDDEGAGSSTRNPEAFKGSLFPKLANMQSQDLYPAASSSKPVEATPRSQPKGWFPRLSEFSTGNLFKSSPAAPAPSSQSARTPRKAAQDDDDDDDDESSDESDAENSHIPKARRATVAKRRTSGLSAYA